jgi:Ca2+-binding EF-hand superfamily protein
MKAENKIENAKIDLALKQDFNCEDAFRIFEFNGRGFITPEDLRYGLKLLDIYATDNDINLLMKRFDLLKEGFINYENFFDMVVPFEKIYRDMVEFRVPNSCCSCRCPEIFSFSTRFALKSLFNLIIEQENKLNLMKRRYTTLRMKLPIIFRLIDRIGINKFYENDLQRYFDNNDILGTEKERNLLYIRLDTDRNGSIEYNEMADELKSIY